MVILRIEHAAASFDDWKRAFDSDPLGRAASGVRRHRVARAADQPNFVTIDLEFESHAEAETMLGRLREMWQRVTVVTDPRARIFTLVEARDSA